MSANLGTDVVVAVLDTALFIIAFIFLLFFAWMLVAIPNVTKIMGTMLGKGWVTLETLVEKGCSEY